jgi:hypothetical protein
VTGGERTPETSLPSSTVPPQPIAYPQVSLDAKNSLDLRKPVDRKDRKGDIRFTCKKIGCALESDTSVIGLSYYDAGTGLDLCRLTLTGTHSHRLTLTVAAAGSEICVKNPAGDIALLVIQVKSTAMPKIGFLVADMTVWQGAEDVL